MGTMPSSISHLRLSDLVLTKVYEPMGARGQVWIQAGYRLLTPSQVRLRQEEDRHAEIIVCPLPLVGGEEGRQD